MLRTFIILLLVISCINCADKLLGNVRASTASPSSGSSSKATAGTSKQTATQTGTRATTRPTTTSPYLTCYVCGGLGQSPCPEPFPSNGLGVYTQYTLRPAFCANVVPGKSAKNKPIRRVADRGECTYNGCKSIGGDTQLCCCNRDYCNTALLSSKSTFTLILSALALLAFFYKF